MHRDFPPDRSVEEAAEAIRRHLPAAPSPAVALVGGSGLGVLATLGQIRGVLPYDRIPGLGAAGVAGHENRWVLAEAQGRTFYCLLGRRHLYEGIDPRTAGLAMRVLARLGVRQVVLTNAAGGLGPRLHPGDLMLIQDHLNLMFRPECGIDEKSAASNLKSDMNMPQSAHARAPQRYDSALSERLRRCALAEGIPLREGVYAGLRGPCYETRAEAALLRRLGADAVGMSTVPEVLAAVGEGLPVAAVSLITNSHWWRGGPASHEEVLAAAAASGRTLARLLLRWLLTE